MNVFQNREEKKINVLFVCADNARHSLIAEALLRSHRVPGVRAFSAGIDPADRADSFALSALTLAGLGNEGLWPKHWDGFANPKIGMFDVVVMIGDDAANALPRTFLGAPEYIVWKFKGTEELRFHRGVWRDIQVLRPHVEALADDLRGTLRCGEVPFQTANAAE